MADIKTRESLHTAKTFDRVQRLAEKTREGANEAKQGINDAFASGESSESEYAGNHLAAYESGAARITIRSVDKIGRWGVRQTAANIRKLRNRPLKTDVNKFKQLTAPERMTLQSGKTVKKARNAAKTAKSAEKSVKSSIKASKTAVKSLKSTVKTTVRAVKAVAKAIVFAVKATAAAVKGIVAAIAAGGWIAVVVIVVVCLIGGLVAGICSIFTPVDNGGYSVSYMVSACENECMISENEIIANTPHDDIEFTGSGMLMKNIVAVYAVKTNTSGDDFIIVDDKNQKEFQRVFDEMYSLRYYTADKEETVMRQYVDADGNPYYVEETIIKTVLHIESNTMTASEAADHFSFNARQREYLDTLMSRNFDDMWAVLLH